MEVKEGLVLSTPADHVIEDEAAYADAVTRAKALADDGHIVLFGIEPDRPETRYGYMKVLPDGKVESFHEKPDEVTANSYFEDGSYLFNSGIFCFRAEVMLKELLAHAPDLMITAQCVYDNRRSGKTTHRLCGRFMEKVPVVSIDKAVMEKSDNLVCVKGIKGWKDMGTFDAFYDHRKKNSKGNVELNVGDAVGCIDSYESRNNLVIVEDKDIVLCGVEDLVVVEVKNKLLIARKGSDIEKAIKAIEG
jgi:mannose-1-phosphate guanylyltransferase